MTWMWGSLWVLSSLLLPCTAQPPSVCVSSRAASPVGSGVACVSAVTGRLTAFSAALAGWRNSSWAVDASTQLSDACVTPAAVVVTGGGALVTVETTCAVRLAAFPSTAPRGGSDSPPGIASRGGVVAASVNVTHVVTYAFEEPLVTPTGTPSLALRVVSASYLEGGDALEAGVGSLDSSVQLLTHDASSLLLQYVPYASAAPLSKAFGSGGGYYAPWRPGSGTFAYGNDGAANEFIMAIPLSTLHAADGSGLALTFALSADAADGPLPPVLNGSTTTDADGVRFTFARGSLRLRGAGTPFATTAYLVATPPDWRAALDWYSTRHAALFVPTAPRAQVAPLWGASGYGDYRGQAVDAAQLRALGLRVNWDASFTFPYWGGWAGTGDAKWADCVAVGHVDSFSGVPHPQQDGTHPPPGVPVYAGTGGCENASLPLVASWYAQLLASTGVVSLAYANVFEWGFALDIPDPACAPENRSALCVANGLWRDGGFSAAYVQDGDFTTAADWEGSKLLRGWPIAPGVKILNPSVEPYRKYLLDALTQQLAAVASPAAGFCMDRMDHSLLMDRSHNDGVAWAAGGPAAWLGASFAAISADMGRLARAAGGASVTSLLNPRLDLIATYDAFLNEYGDVQRYMPAYGLLGLSKPTSGWYWSAHRPPPVEVYLRQCLIAGQSPMVPWELADHAIVPKDGKHPDPTPTFLDYAPLYTLLEDKRWLLSHRAVVLDAAALAAGLWANAYVTSVGLLLPIADGEGKGVPSQPVSLSFSVGAAFGSAPRVRGAWALYPGGGNVSVTPVPLADNATWYLSASLGTRGCVVVQVQFE